MICAPFTVPLRHANHSFANQIAYSLLIAANRNSNNHHNNFRCIPKLINCRERLFYGTIIDFRFAHIQLCRWYSRHIHWTGLFSRMCGIILIGITLPRLSCTAIHDGDWWIIGLKCIKIMYIFLDFECNKKLLKHFFFQSNPIHQNCMTFSGHAGRALC